MKKSHVVHLVIAAMTFVVGTSLFQKTLTSSERIHKIAQELSPQQVELLVSLLERQQRDSLNLDAFQPGFELLKARQNPMNSFNEFTDELVQQVKLSSVDGLTNWQVQDLSLNTMRLMMKDSARSIDVKMGIEGRIGDAENYIRSLDPLSSLVHTGWWDVSRNFERPTTDWAKYFQYRNENSLRSSISEMFWPVVKSLESKSEEVDMGYRRFWSDDPISNFCSRVCVYIWQWLQPLVTVAFQVPIVRLIFVTALVCLTVTFWSYVGAEFLLFSNRNS